MKIIKNYKFNHLINMLIHINIYLHNYMKMRINRAFDLHVWEIGTSCVTLKITFIFHCDLILIMRQSQLIFE